MWTVTVGAALRRSHAGPGPPLRRRRRRHRARHDTNTVRSRLPGLTRPTETGDDTVWSYHLRAGIGYQLSETVILFAGYRFIGAQDVEIAGTRSTSASDALEAGVRIRF